MKNINFLCTTVCSLKGSSSIILLREYILVRKAVIQSLYVRDSHCKHGVTNENNRSS